MTPEMIFVTREESGERLDKLLARRFEPHHSRTYFQYLIDNHLVLLNGHPVKKRIKPSEGDEIEVNFAAAPQTDIKPEPIPLEILFEDDHLIAINKPDGMVVHPAPGNWSKTFVNALLHHCRDLPNTPDNIRPGVVHRLDKQTTGVLVAAKSLFAQQHLINQFANREVVKTYLALCAGRPGEGEVSAPIARHPVHRKKMAVIEGGKAAVSRYETLAYNDQFSLVQISPLTGRTHQIRVHMNHLGFPILGDAVYGHASFNQKLGAQRQMLHASELTLQHPVTGDTLTFHAPMPHDMDHFVKLLGK